MHGGGILDFTMKQSLEASHPEEYEAAVPFGEDLILATASLLEALQSDREVYFQDNSSGGTLIEISDEGELESDPGMAHNDHMQGASIPFGRDCMHDVGDPKQPILGATREHHRRMTIIDGKDVVDDVWWERDEE